MLSHLTTLLPIRVLEAQKVMDKAVQGLIAKAFSEPVLEPGILILEPKCLIIRQYYFHLPAVCFLIVPCIRLHFIESDSWLF